MTREELFMIKGVVEYTQNEQTHSINVGISADWWAVPGHADRVARLLTNRLSAWGGLALYKSDTPTDEPREITT